MNESENKALTDELIAKEEKFNQILGALVNIFPDKRVERIGGYIYITSNSASFLGSELNKLNALSTVFGNAGYYITASVTKGLQAVIF